MAAKPKPGARTAQSAAHTRRAIAPTPPARGRGFKWLYPLFVAAATFAVYWPVLKYPFVNYDDVDYVTQNRHVQQGLSLATIRWAVTSNTAGNWHPLTWMSHALDFDLFGLYSAGHHFTSLFLHAANAVLLFLLLNRATALKWRSLMVAALFAIHPINVESVAWVAERKTVLCMFFLLLALAAYGWYARKPTVGRYISVCVLFLLALAAKPMAVTLPFALLLIDFWPLHRIKGWLPVSPAFPLRQYPIRQLLLEKLPLLALSAASSGVTLVAQRPAMKTMQAFPFGDRVANAVFSYGMYVYKVFWPAHLSVFYAPQGAKLAAWQVMLSLMFIASMTALVWRSRARPYLLIGWLWFLGTMVPMIGLIQVGEQGMADRYAYLPFLGLFTMVVWGVADFFPDKQFDKQSDERWNAIRAIAPASAIVLVLGILTWRQVHTWQSSFVLWSHSLEVTEENYVAEDFVGTTLLQDAFERTGESCANQALGHFQNAVRINPKDTLGHINVGFCRQAHGDLPGAIAEYKTALESARNKYLRSRAFLNLGAAYQEMGDFADSHRNYQEALSIYPRDPDILAGLAKLNAEEKIKH